MSVKTELPQKAAECFRDAVGSSTFHRITGRVAPKWLVERSFDRTTVQSPPTVLCGGLERVVNFYIGGKVVAGVTFRSNLNGKGKKSPWFASEFFFSDNPDNPRGETYCSLRDSQGDLLPPLC